MASHYTTFPVLYAIAVTILFNSCHVAAENGQIVVNCFQNSIAARHERVKQETHREAYRILQYFRMFGERQTRKYLSTYMTAMYANECKAIADDVIKVIDAIPTKQPNDRTNAPKSCQEYANQLQRELNRLIELLMCHASKYLIKMPTREDLEPKFLEQRSRSSSLSSAGPADLNKPRFEHTYNKLNQQIDCAIGATSIIAEQLATMKVENIKPWATSKMNELSSLNHVDEVIVCEKVTDVVAELFNILRKHHKSNKCLEIQQHIHGQNIAIATIVHSASIDYHIEDAHLNTEFNHDLELGMDFSMSVYHYLLQDRRLLSEKINKWQEIINSHKTWLLNQNAFGYLDRSAFIVSCTKLNEELTAQLAQSNDYRQKLRTVFKNAVVFVPLIPIEWRDFDEEQISEYINTRYTEEFNQQLENSPANRQLQLGLARHKEWFKQKASGVLRTLVHTGSSDSDTFDRAHSYYVALRTLIGEANAYGASVLHEAHIGLNGPKPVKMEDIPLFDDSGSLI